MRNLNNTFLKKHEYSLNFKLQKIMSDKQKHYRETKEKTNNARSVIFQCTVRHNQKNPYETGLSFSYKTDVIPSPHYSTIHIELKGQVSKTTHALVTRCQIMHKIHATKLVNATDKQHK